MFKSVANTPNYRSLFGCGLVSLALLTACSSEQSAAPTTSEELDERPMAQNPPRKRTGAEIQDRILNNVVHAVYLCENSERLTVDFDNPRRMATVRTSSGEAVDLYQEVAADGIWYRSSQVDLRGRGAIATWSVEGRQPTTCRAVD